MKKPKTMLDHALALAKLGFRVIPVTPMKKKKPLRKVFWRHASRLEERVRRLWKKRPTANPAISTTRFRDGALLVIDIDPKHKGPNTLEGLKLIMGYEFPDTYEQRTPSGGTHLVYYVPHACAGLCGKDGLGPGLDVRSHHNYILGAGAQTAAGVYTNVVRPVAMAPDWLLAWAAAHPPAAKQAGAVSVASVDRRRALRRATAYLQKLAPAPNGQRDALAYKAACKLRGFGLSQADTVDQMVAGFRFDGVFHDSEIEHAVDSAFKYAKGGAGEEAPLDAGAYFAPIEPEEAPESASPAGKTASGEPALDPTDTGDQRALFNKDHAVVMLGNKLRIMWRTLDYDGRPKREFLTVEDFDKKYAGYTMPSKDGKKMLETSKQWLRWHGRLSYDGLVFAPGRKVPSNYCNTWEGFAYEPLAKGEKPTADMREALEMFKQHLLVNAAAEEARHAKWLTNFFAHLVQRPGRKPRVAPVFKGKRGSGKSSIAQWTGALVEPHLFVAADQRYLVGNFNSHMSETLMFVLEEAFWGGSKSAEAVLKEVVTGGKLTIEQKFREAFRTENYMRVIIIGNEEWQVPAALQAERRWAVFNVEMRNMPTATEADRSKVAAWFRRMYHLMEHGGYRYLLTYLMDYEMDEALVNEAPMTSGLVEQIEHTLPPLYQWWLECLQDGRIVEGGFGSKTWPRECPKEDIRDAFKRYCDHRNIDGRLPSAVATGRDLRKVCPSLRTDKKNRDNDWVYKLPPLSVARAEWAKVVGRAPVWPDDVEI